MEIQIQQDVLVNAITGIPTRREPSASAASCKRLCESSAGAALAHKAPCPDASPALRHALYSTLWRARSAPMLSYPDGWICKAQDALMFSDAGKACAPMT